MGLVLTSIKYIVFYIPPNWLQLFSIHIFPRRNCKSCLFPQWRI